MKKEYIMENRYLAFTLAETLITLGIIGVVAVLTLPGLINNIQDKQFDRAREKALKSIGEAGRILAVQGDITSGANAEDFVKNHLSRHLKIANYCGLNFSDCGFTNKIKAYGGVRELSIPKNIQGLSNGNLYYAPIANKNSNLYVYSFLTADGFGSVLYYNPDCQGRTKASTYNHFTGGKVCMNVIYDMNGLRGPNEFGRDVGAITVFYPDEMSQTIAVPRFKKEIEGNFKPADLGKACNGKNEELPSAFELAALAYNLNFFDNPNPGYYWSGTKDNYSGGKPVQIQFNLATGGLYQSDAHWGGLARCKIK